MDDNPEKDTIDDGGTTLNMTLLDYFAGQALVGIRTSYDADTMGTLLKMVERENTTISDYFAGVAYGFAQAMIAEKRRLET